MKHVYKIVFDTYTVIDFSAWTETYNFSTQEFYTVAEDENKAANNFRLLYKKDVGYFKIVLIQELSRV